MKLYNFLTQNASLKFIDAENREEKLFSDLDLIDIDSSVRQLAFLYLDNSLYSVEIFLSFVRSEHAIVLLSPDISEEMKLDLEQKYMPTFIFDQKRNSIFEYFPSIAISLFEAIKKNTVVIAAEIKILLSTSGTTGSPKFVKLSEDNLIANAISITEYLPILSSDVTPLNLPIYYSYGLSVFTSNCYKGGTIVCTNKTLIEKDFWVDFEQYRYSTFAGVPYVYEMLDRIGFTKKEYNSLRYFTQAGGKLHNKLQEKFGNYALENKKDFFVMYGQTEATARMAYLPADKVIEKMGTIGIAIPNGNLEIDSDNNELVYYGENVFGGYAEQINDLLSFNQSMPLRTGDIAEQDIDGYFYIKGRLKRFVKLFGNRINLDEVEKLIFDRLGDSVKCVGIEDKYLLLVSDIYVDFDSVKKELVESLKLHKTVIKSMIVEELPLTQNGKTNYQKLLELYENR